MAGPRLSQRPAAMVRLAGRRDQQAWSDQDNALESLPPAGEVHHDWPGHDDRTSRGWPAPGQDDEGESW